MKNCKIKKNIGKSFSIGNLFYIYYEESIFWFRVFNSYGIYGKKNDAKMVQLFSERNGYAKFVNIFGWKFTLLTP